jgi:hypothetical protein
MLRRSIILFSFASLLFFGCEVSTTVSVDRSVPPTFTIHGSGGIYHLRVYDMTDPKSMKGKWWDRPGIWEIVPPAGGSMIRDIPHVTYGVLPALWEQKTPHTGPPPALIEGRVYWVWTPSFDADGGGSNKFMISDGQTVEVK